MALGKTDLVAEIAGEADVDRRSVKAVLDTLALIAADEIANGEDFTVPGICALKFTYRAPLKKGAKYKKGETYVGFGGIENTAEADSKPVSERITLKASPTGLVRKEKPGTRPEAQRTFLKSKAGRNVKGRKA
jgi:nucleoid DNA-binding protein